MKTILIIFTTGIITILIIDYTLCVIYCNHVNSFFRQSEIPKSDAAVVFFGDFDGDGRLGEETVRRLRHTQDLYNLKTVNHIICVGGNRLAQKKGISGSGLMKKYLIVNGVPEKNIFVDAVSYDSFTNWAEARKIIEHHNWNSVILVSSALHLYRLAGMITGNGINVAYSPYSSECISSITDFFSKRSWIHHEWLAVGANKILLETWYSTLRNSMK
ncbi:MAG: YdcF family protein [Candidatus Latescibacteria bacterium]|nr:YdcF family protein [Candidatus Latescibacterota bacterium]